MAERNQRKTNGHYLMERVVYDWPLQRVGTRTLYTLGIVEILEKKKLERDLTCKNDKDVAAKRIWNNMQHDFNSIDWEHEDAEHISKRFIRSLCPLCTVICTGGHFIQA